MTQEEVSRIVFSFDRKTCETNIFSNKQFEYNFIRDAIQHAPIMNGIPSSRIPSFQLFQIKKSETVSKEGIQRCTLQFIDISKEIFYDDIKAQEDYATLMNSNISHEMRNPLNSIINQCLIQENNLLRMRKLNISEKYERFIHEIEQSNIIQRNSSQLLLFHVEDVLGMA